MKDLIERQVIINELEPWLKIDGYSEGELNMLKAVLYELENMPSAQLEPCGEMVSREVVVKFFDDWMSALDINCHHQSVADLRIIKGDIKNLPSAQPLQRWIPCGEKLPEKGKDVLVTRHYLGEEDNNKSCYYTEVAARYGDDDNPDWISYSDEYKMHPKNHIVIAWQELPEPYKGENE